VDVNKLDDVEYKEIKLKELEREAYQRILEKKSRRNF